VVVVQILVRPKGVLQSTDVENATNNLRWFVENAINGGSLIENIPTTGMATYDGLIAINKTTPSDPTGTPDDLYYGRIQINADFSTTAVNGSMGDFGAINTSSFDANGFPNLRSVPGNASFSGNITDQFMGFTTNRGMYATNVAGSLDGEVVTGDISGLFYTDTQTGLQIIDGGADLSIGSDVDVRTSFIAAD